MPLTPGVHGQEKRRLATEVAEQAGAIADLQARLEEARQAAQRAPAAPAPSAPESSVSVPAERLRLEARVCTLGLSNTSGGSVHSGTRGCGAKFLSPEVISICGVAPRTNATPQVA